MKSLCYISWGIVNVVDAFIFLFDSELFWWGDCIQVPTKEIVHKLTSGTPRMETISGTNLTQRKRKYVELRVKKLSNRYWFSEMSTSDVGVNCQYNSLNPTTYVLKFLWLDFFQEEKSYFDDETAFQSLLKVS